MLAKLACGLHKPSQQTILPLSSAAEVFADLPFKKVWALLVCSIDFVADLFVS